LGPHGGGGLTVDCERAQSITHAYVDGELDLGTTLDFERHIHGCERCAQVRQSIQTLRGVIRDGGAFFKAPATLEQRIRADLRTARGGSSSPPAVVRWRWLALAATIACLAVGMWALMRAGRSDSSRELVLAQE